MQRLRITFGRGGAAKYLSHLELMKAWERVFRRAGWKLVYSQGFNPHPKISFAAALPVGVAAEAELVEVQIESSRSAEEAREELAAQLPPGLEVRAVEEVPVDEAPLQRSLRAAEYVAVCSMPFPGDLSSAVLRVMGAKSLPRRRAKEGKAVEYDLRPMIHEIAVGPGSNGAVEICMQLRTDAQGAGRADEVLRELGLDPADCQITRTRLLLADA